MDYPWMRERLENFIDLAGRYEASQRGAGYSVRDPALRAELHRAEPTLKKILAALDPEAAARINVDQMAGPVMAANEAQRGLGMLADIDELRVRLKPEAPSLPADQMHPWVWSPAQTFWDSGHFRSGVATAANSISDHTQGKLGRRDASDDKLMSEAFSDKPPQPGCPRLRVPGDPTSLTVQSQRRGALQFGMGCFFLIRNPVAHGTQELPEQEALEYLAALSVLARIIDASTVVTA
jgi:hypothetical protein